MNNKLLKIIFLSSIILSFLSFDLPSEWIKGGSHRDSYQMGIDTSDSRNGKHTSTIKSIEKDIDGFGTLMQISLPNEYLGKRIRMSGYIKSKEVADWAGLWLRVDHPKTKKPIAFDNMYDRSITGTTDWTKYEIVLDVSKNASKIAYGALLVGTGQIWFDDIAFEVVDSTVSLTGLVSPYFSTSNFQSSNPVVKD